MQYSNTTTKAGCIQFVESLCRLGDGGITSDTTLFKQITSYFNQADKKVSIALLRSDNHAKWDDSKYTDFPIAYIDLVNNQRDYTLPGSTTGGNFSTNWKINQIRVKNSNGDYVVIEPMAEGEVETSDAGFPSGYNLLGSSLRFNCLIDSSKVTTTSGLEITFQRSGVEFTTSSTTEQPGYIDAYHDLPCYDTAATYLLPLQPELSTRYSQIFESRLALLQKDWKSKDAKGQDIITSPYVDAT